MIGLINVVFIYTFTIYIYPQFHPLHRYTQSFIINMIQG